MTALETKLATKTRSWARLFTRVSEIFSLPRYVVFLRLSHPKNGSSWNFFILIVKQDALDNRLKFSSDYDRALKNTRSKRENYEKLKSNPQSKPEKVSKAQSDVAEAEKEESDAKDLFFNTTESLKLEFDRADQERLQDFKSRLSETVQNQIYYEKKILQMFQELLPELENIVVV